MSSVAGCSCQEWKNDLAGLNSKAADALADPDEYPNLFPGLEDAVAAEPATAKTQAAIASLPASQYARLAADGGGVEALVAQLQSLGLAQVCMSTRAATVH